MVPNANYWQLQSLIAPKLSGDPKALQHQVFKKNWSTVIRRDEVIGHILLKAQSGCWKGAFVERANPDNSEDNLIRNSEGSKYARAPH
ncbi:conserved hypothetical protein [Ricinus communis]|uniref:Uncharacterized protein n=1 Tax=Ricinus communis TaxID=3988 RepID=B9S626_RICCO|nr:conserved hypothetical protein [Ricinus communis]